MQVLVPSLPQNDKTKVFTGLSTQTIGTFYSCKHSNIVKLTTCSSLACHAEQSEATACCTILRFTQDKRRHIGHNRQYIAMYNLCIYVPMW